MEEFKLIVAGGRDFTDTECMETAIRGLANDVYTHKAISIVSGMAKGADSLGYFFAVRNHVAVYKFPANWNKHGRSAGMIRNKEMGDFADGLLAFWDGKSRGTKQMIEYMTALRKPVDIILY